MPSSLDESILDDSPIHRGTSEGHKGRRRRLAIAIVGIVSLFVVGLVLIFMGTRGSRFVIPPADDVLTIVKNREGQGEQPCLGQRISVLVWNIQKGQASGFADAFAARSANRDLVLLQELHLTAATRAVVAGGNVAYRMATAFIYRKDSTRAGVAIGSSVAPLSVTAQVTPATEPIVGTPKSSILATYPIPPHCGAGGRRATLLVVSVHGINRAAYDAFMAQVDALSAAMAAHVGPIVLGGDFNTQSEEKTEYLATAAAGAGLTQVVFSPDDRTLSKLSRRPLDHVYVRGASVEGSSTQTGGSDHASMTFDLVFDA